MDIIYRINGSDLTRDKNVSYSPQIGWKVIVNGNQFVMQSTTVDLDSEEDVLYIELAKSDEVIEGFTVSVNPDNGVAKCINVFAHGKSLTIGKDYTILKTDDTHFTIINDEGIRKKYKHGNSQFIIY